MPEKFSVGDKMFVLRLETRTEFVCTSIQASVINIVCFYRITGCFFSLFIEYKGCTRLFNILVYNSF